MDATTNENLKDEEDGVFVDKNHILMRKLLPTTNRHFPCSILSDF